MKQPKTRIYLDYAAATPVDPRVMVAIAPIFHEVCRNSASLSVPAAAPAVFVRQYDSPSTSIFFLTPTQSTT